MFIVKKPLILLPIITGLFMPFKAQATDIKNEDSRSYNLRIELNKTTYTNQIGLLSTLTNICDQKCKISIRGASIEAEKDDVIILKNGQFSRQPKPIIPQK